MTIQIADLLRTCRHGDLDCLALRAGRELDRRRKTGSWGILRAAAKDADSMHTFALRSSRARGLVGALRPWQPKTCRMLVLYLAKLKLPSVVYVLDALAASRASEAPAQGQVVMVAITALKYNDAAATMLPECILTICDPSQALLLQSLPP